MIDLGLLATMAIVVILPTTFVRPWPESAAEAGVIDVAGGALLLGILIGRLATVALDDPGSLTNLRDLLIIRSGVEFWPGVAAGIAWIAFHSKKEGVSPARRLAAISATSLVAWACFEFTCLLRDGCPGPRSSLGLRPDGLVERMFPVGLLVAAAAVTAAFVIRRLHRKGMPDAQVVVLSLFAIAIIRSVASIWLPRIGQGPTRQHRTSILVAAVTAVTFVGLRRQATTSEATAKA